MFVKLFISFWGNLSSINVSSFSSCCLTIEVGQIAFRRRIHFRANAYSPKREMFGCLNLASKAFSHEVGTKRDHFFLQKFYELLFVFHLPLRNQVKSFLA